MRADALAPYEVALRHLDPSLALHTRDGRAFPLDVARWASPADPADGTVLDRCRGPVLDIGCGPGRFVRALQQRAVAALGVDIAKTSVQLTRRLGGQALQRSVFAELPGEGRWATVLLMDGNVGIDGDPVRLLTRIRTLLAPDGQLLVETFPDPHAGETVAVRFGRSGVIEGPEFDWTHVGVHRLHQYTERTGYHIDETWTADQRTFAVLCPTTATTACAAGTGRPAQ